MFVVTVEFDVNKKHAAAFQTAVLKQADNSLSREADCLRFDVCFDPKDNTRIFLYEIYSDESAFEKHMQTEHFRNFGNKVKDWLVRKTVQTWVGRERKPGEISASS